MTGFSRTVHDTPVLLRSVEPVTFGINATMASSRKRTGLISYLLVTDMPYLLPGV